MEEGGEDVAVAVLRGCVHRCVGTVALLIAGLRLFPTCLGAYLGRDERRGTVGKVETAELTLDAQPLEVLALPLLTGHGIAEGEVFVGHLEDDAEALLVFVLDVEHGLRGLVVALRSLGAAHGVSVADRRQLGIDNGQFLRHVADAGLQAQGRGEYHWLAVETGRIVEPTAGIADRHLQAARW